MIKRVVSGAVLVLFLAAVILFNRSFPLALNLVVALVSAASVFELTKALGLERKWFLFLPSLAMAAAASFCGENLFAVYCLYTLVLFSAMLRYHRETTFKEGGGAVQHGGDDPQRLKLPGAPPGAEPGPRDVLRAGGGAGRLGGGRGRLFRRDLFRQAQALPGDQPQEDGGGAPRGGWCSTWR